MKTADRRKPKPLGYRARQPRSWRGRSEPISFDQVGCEARKIPALGEIFLLTSSFIELGLDGQGGSESFADYGQWEIWQKERRRAWKETMTSSPPIPSPLLHRYKRQTKLSYFEAREYAAVEQRITDAEQRLQSKRAALEDARNCRRRTQARCRSS